MESHPAPHGGSRWRPNEPVGSDDHFLTRFPDGEEFIWLNDVRINGDGFEGRVNNEPVNSVGIAMGQVVKISRDELVDWMFMSKGKLRGGYTIVALVYGTPEQTQYEKNMGIDWSQYKFLKD